MPCYAYVAFLRGINVGGHKLIKMQELSRMFESFGLKHVKTIIASGNVMFESSEKNESPLARNIEKRLQEQLGYRVDVMLRSLSAIEEILLKNPFQKIKCGNDIKLYVTFLAEETPHKLKLPFKSSKKDFEIVSMSGREVFSLSFKTSDGRFGNSAGFIEKEFKVPATTRNWNTLRRIMECGKKKTD